MKEKTRKRGTVFGLLVSVLTAVTVLLMVGSFVFDAVRPSGEWWVDVERTDRSKTSVSEEEDGDTDGLLEGEVMDLNTAAVADLGRLPGVGKVRAQAIEAYRQEHGAFGTVDELLRVDGIGSKTLERLRPYVTVG